MTTELIKKTITEESGMPFAVINEKTDRLSIRVTDNTHQFTITEEGTEWGVWLKHEYYDEQGFYNDEDLLSELRNIY